MDSEQDRAQFQSAMDEAWPKRLTAEQVIELEMDQMSYYDHNTLQQVYDQGRTDGTLALATMIGDLTAALQSLTDKLEEMMTDDT